MFRAVLAGVLALGLSSIGQAQNLSIGLQDDPDVLDPHRSRTFAARVVLSALCDRLVDTDPSLNVVPRLATAWTWENDRTLRLTLRPGVVFHDGEPLDAAAVKYNLDRARTLPDSFRRGELAAVESVEAVGPMEVAVRLSRPDASLLAQLSDRAGMILSPKAAEAGPQAYGARPVCSGPFSFVERVAQDRIVFQRFERHWNASAIGVMRLTYRPIPDSTVRLANLRSGELQLIERVAPTDAASLRTDRRVALIVSGGLGFQSINVNVANGPRAANPLGQDRRVREAFSLAIDREALVRAVFDGIHQPGIQSFPPGSPWNDAETRVPARNLERARALLREAGVTTRVPVELMVPTSTTEQAVAQVVQAMTAEAGFDVSIRAVELGTLLRDTAAGAFQASQNGWGGRVDPDGNMHGFYVCNGNFNEPKYCDAAMDALLNEARSALDPAKRRTLYAQAVRKAAQDLPWIHLYHPQWIWATAAQLSGFRPHPDGLIRLEGIRIGQ